MRNPENLCFNIKRNFSLLHCSIHFVENIIKFTTMWFLHMFIEHKLACLEIIWEIIRTILWMLYQLHSGSNVMQSQRFGVDTQLNYTELAAAVITANPCR